MQLETIKAWGASPPKPLVLSGFGKAWVELKVV